MELPGSGTKEDPIVVTEDGGLFVLHPDTLVAGTKVASSYW